LARTEKSGPFQGEVHAPRPLTDEERKDREERLGKMEPRPLYVRRDVLNGAEIIRWAKAQGFTTTLPADELHVTIAYSKNPVDWMAAEAAWNQDEKGRIFVGPGGPRVIEEFNGGAVVLRISDWNLEWAHNRFKEIGASWDHDGYSPHITITYSKPEELDLSQIEPYRGRVELGPEIFEAIDPDDGWKDKLVEKAEGQLSFCKVAGIEEDLGLVLGWAIVCKVDGEDYYDLNIDKSGERVPEHITEKAMLKAAVDFAESARAGNEMHSGPDVGQHVFVFPMTTEIAKAAGITTNKTGLLVGYKPTAEVLAKFKDGTYKGFSIEGSRVKSEETVHG
jgi:hypothetical protein